MIFQRLDDVRSLFLSLNLISLGKNSSYFQRDNIRYKSIEKRCLKRKWIKQ